MVDRQMARTAAGQCAAAGARPATFNVGVCGRFVRRSRNRHGVARPRRQRALETRLPRIGQHFPGGKRFQHALALAQWLQAGAVCGDSKTAKMSNRAWICVPCRKSFRREQSVTALKCPHCHKRCERLHWKMRIPSARRARVWDEFWAKYEGGKVLTELRQSAELELLIQSKINKQMTKRRRT